MKDVFQKGCPLFRANKAGETVEGQVSRVRTPYVEQVQNLTASRVTVMFTAFTTN